VNEIRRIFLFHELLSCNKHINYETFVIFNETER